MALPVLRTPAHTTAAPPALAMPAPSRPPISACELDEGMPPHQVIRFQAMAPISAPKMTRASTIVGRDDAGADGLGHVQAEEQEGDEVEEGRPGDGVARLQHARRHDGGDRVRGVVQAVEEVEGERHDDEDDEDRQAEEAASMLAPSQLIDDEGVDLVRHVLEPVDHLLQVIVDLGADDEGHGVALPVLARNSALRPWSWSWSACSSMRMICSVSALRRVALLPMELSSGTAFEHELGRLDDDVAHVPASAARSGAPRTA